ncbi:hypothetical protein K439DRAFT_1625240 [Ramaria rubella]|nr:hypothetical protein K439DRAFT_1625240 [Ramaria rubella]
MAPSFNSLLKEFQTKVLTEPEQGENLLDEIEMWVKEMEGIDDDLSDAIEARLSIQLKFTIPAKVTEIPNDIKAAKSWVSGGITVALPNLIATAAVGLVIPSAPVAPLFSKGALTEDLMDDMVDELTNDDIAIVSRREAKFLGGVGIADTHQIAMPAEYGDGSAYHIAGFLY